MITNGNRRFTRALYGTNTVFRVEAGDLPEFAMYMPGMDGNLKTGSNTLRANIRGDIGNRTIFVQLKQGQFTWWYPLCFKVELRLLLPVPTVSCRIA